MFPTKATGNNFIQRGHSVSDVRITILEKMKSSDESYRKERERYLINKFSTYELTECLSRLYLFRNCKVNLS